jgi:hypothetical protein
MTITLESVDIDPESLKTLKADDRGRVNLGTEFADKRVTVLVQEVEE